MANDVHYFTIATTIFMLLGIVAPLLESELTGLGVDIKEGELQSSNSVGDIIIEDESFSAPTIVKILLNLFLFAFWTFGLPVWFNILFLFFRLPLIFVLSRNIWVGGGS